MQRTAACVEIVADLISQILPLPATRAPQPDILLIYYFASY